VLGQFWPSGTIPLAPAVRSGRQPAAEAPGRRAGGQRSACDPP